ncbi:MAG: hypothetical protein Kow001_04010 [Acidobacteriota bacterium]
MIGVPFVPEKAQGVPAAELAQRFVARFGGHGNYQLLQLRGPAELPDDPLQQGPIPDVSEVLGWQPAAAEPHRYEGRRFHEVPLNRADYIGTR